MLFALVYGAAETDTYNNAFDSLSKAFWPEDEFRRSYMDLARAFYSNHQQRALLGGNGSLPMDEWQKEHKNILSKCIENKTPMYEFATGSPATPLPFFRHYYQLFFERKGDLVPLPQPVPGASVIPLWNFEQLAQDACRLSNQQQVGGPSQLTYPYCSKNAANYNHFRNVVVALGRLIGSLQSGTNGDAVEAALTRAEAPLDDFKAWRFPHDRPAPNQPLGMEHCRVLMLMLAGCYHDLGKVVADARHATEGSIIIRSHSRTPPSEFGAIVAGYAGSGGRSPVPDISQAWINYIATLVAFHDLFGTLATGENGYMNALPLVEAATEIGRCLAEEEAVRLGRPKRAFGREDWWRWSRRVLFDAWLLNAADIMVSLERHPEIEYTKSLSKWTDHRHWRTTGFEAKISEFFEANSKSDTLVSDFAAIDRLLCAHLQGKTSREIEADALALSESRGPERVRRLVRETMLATCYQYRQANGVGDFDLLLDDALQLLGSEELSRMVNQAIREMGNATEFGRQVRYIGQSDYSLGFFQKLIRSALDRVKRELEARAAAEQAAVGPVTRTHWVSSSRGRSNASDARFIVSNACSIVVGIFGRLVSRSRPFEGLVNLEFKDAADRLTDDKIEGMLCLAGPNRFDQMSQFGLQRVFYW